MIFRQYNHNSELDKRLIPPDDLILMNPVLIHSPEEQIEILTNKKCDCNIQGMTHWLNDMRKYEKIVQFSLTGTK